MAVSVKALVWTGCICTMTTGLLTYQAGRSRQQLDLSSTKAPFAVLARAQLSNARLSAVDLRQADLHYADLEQSDLHDANLQHANLIRARLRGATLCGADLRAATLDGADLAEADVHGALYDEDTTWPDRFDPDASGAIRAVRLEHRSAMTARMTEDLPHHRHQRAGQREVPAQE